MNGKNDVTARTLPWVVDKHERLKSKASVVMADLSGRTTSVQNFINLCYMAEQQ